MSNNLYHGFSIQLYRQNKGSFYCREASSIIYNELKTASRGAKIVAVVVVTKLSQHQQLQEPSWQHIHSRKNIYIFSG